MTSHQAERLIAALERIAAALERTADLDPMAALAEVLDAHPETAGGDPPNDPAQAWRFR